MRKSEKLKSIKVALLLTVAYDAEINPEITDHSGKLLDDLYDSEVMKGTNFLFDMSKRFEERLTKNPLEISILLLEALKDIKGTKRFQGLIEKLERVPPIMAYKSDLNPKVDTIVRRAYEDYKDDIKQMKS